MASNKSKCLRKVPNNVAHELFLILHVDHPMHRIVTIHTLSSLCDAFPLQKTRSPSLERNAYCRRKDQLKSASMLRIVVMRKSVSYTYHPHKTRNDLHQTVTEMWRAYQRKSVSYTYHPHKTRNDLHQTVTEMWRAYQ